MDPTTMRVDELREGDMVDLEGDPFADPDRAEDWLRYGWTAWACVSALRRITGCS